MVSSHQKLLRIQKKIYAQLKRESIELLGPPPPAIRAYARKAHHDLSGRPAVCPKSTLIRAIRGADVSFIGDFHTFAQAQRTALRLMRQAIRGNENWAIGLEMVSSEHQRALDSFQAGRISRAVFHRRIRYSESWGFAWSHYEPIFVWAREHGVRLLALNRPAALLHPGREPLLDDLRLRDEWAAGILTDHLTAQRDSPRSGRNHRCSGRPRVIVLYGELHVARAHIPAALSRISRAFNGRAVRSVTIHQNSELLFWKLAQRERELQTPALKFSGDTYCLFSSPPWVKLQSLVHNIHSHIPEHSHEHPGEFDGPESEQDSVFAMQADARLIADFWGLPAPDFSAVTVFDLSNLKWRSLARGLSSRERKLAEALVSAHERFYLPATRIAYLATPSRNSIGQLAAAHLRREQTRSLTWYPGTREDFFRVVIASAFDFLGSLILNPQRKCDTSAMHRKRAQLLTQDLARAEFPGERAARQLAAKFLSSKPEKIGNLPPLAISRWMAARWIGYSLAKDLYPRLLAVEHEGYEFRGVRNRLLRRAEFEKTYTELLAGRGESDSNSSW